MCNRGLGVKALLIYLHLLGESLSGISDGSKKVGEERELGVRVGEGGEDAKAFTLTCLSVRRIGKGGEGEGLFPKSTDVRVRTRA